MKKTVLSNFKILTYDRGNLPDHTILISFIPKTKEDFAFTRTPTIIKSQYLGIIDYSINDQNYDCYVLYEDTDIDAVGLLKESFVYFVPKSPIDGGKPEDKHETSQPAQHINNAIPGENYKSIRSYPDGISKVLISDNAVIIKSGESMIHTDKNGVSIYGHITHYNLPETSNAIIKENGLMSILPKAFVPPFCTPERLPDMDLPVQVSSSFETLKKMRGVI